MRYLIDHIVFSQVQRPVLVTLNASPDSESRHRTTQIKLKLSLNNVCLYSISRISFGLSTEGCLHKIPTTRSGRTSGRSAIQGVSSGRTPRKSTKLQLYTTAFYLSEDFRYHWAFSIYDEAGRVAYIRSPSRSNNQAFQYQPHVA